MGCRASSGCGSCGSSCCELAVQVFGAELVRRPVAESRMDSASIIEQLDLPRNLLPCVFAWGVGAAVYPLGLEHTIKRFHEGILGAAPVGPSD